MHKSTIPLIMGAMFSVLLLFGADFQKAYAIAGFQTLTTINVTGGLSFDTCGGIATTPVSNYIIQQCVVAGGTTQTTVASFADGTLIDTATRTVGTGETANTNCWAITNTQVVCETGRASPTQVVLIRATVTASDNISVSSFTLGAGGTIAGGINSIAGTSVYWGESDGSFNRFSLSTFSQSGEWTGLETSGCTTLRNALVITANIGLSICDTNEAYLFSFSGSSGAVTIEDSATLSGDFSSGISTEALYSNNWIYITDRLANEVQAIGVNLNTIEFTTNVVEYPIFGNDLKGAENYILILDGSSDQLYLLDKEVDAPNNIVVVQSLSTVIDSDGKLTTSDSSNFYWSKGTSGSTTVRYFLGTQLRNENDIPVINEDNPTGNQQNGVCGVGTALDCVGNRGTINAITGAPALTTVVTDLGNGLGIFNSTNTDPETNGSGLVLMLATGALFSSAIIASIAFANQRFNANIPYTEIPKELWLFLVVGVIALSWYLNWIPDIVFYGMIVGLAGLFAFGIYKHVNRSG